MHHYNNINTLGQSARAGCAVCDLFLHSIPVQIISDLGNGYEFSGVWLFRVGSGFQLRLDFVTCGRVLGASVLGLGTTWSHERLGEVLHPPENTDSDQNWDQIGEWIDLRVDGHKSYQIGHTERHLPTRLIDVGKYDGEVTLRLSGCLPQNPQYLTLSHCWGNYVIEKLTIVNLVSMLDRIPAEALNQTFRDAFTVTRKLGLRYIWIDSLCIIQDSFEDWVKEVTQMSKAYSCSFLNIAALDAPDGCFFSGRNPVADVQVEWRNGFKVLMHSPPLLDTNRESRSVGQSIYVKSFIKAFGSPQLCAYVNPLVDTIIYHNNNLPGAIYFVKTCEELWPTKQKIWSAGNHVVFAIGNILSMNLHGVTVVKMTTRSECAKLPELGKESFWKGLMGEEVDFEYQSSGCQRLGVQGRVNGSLYWGECEFCPFIGLMN